MLRVNVERLRRNFDTLGRPRRPGPENEHGGEVWHAERGLLGGDPATDTARCFFVHLGVDFDVHAGVGTDDNGAFEADVFDADTAEV